MKTIGIVCVFSLSYQRRRGGGEQRVRRQADQLLRVSLEETRVVRGIAVLDPDIPSVARPQTAQRIGKGRRMRTPVVLGPRHQHADAAHPLGLLGVPGERPCGGSAEDGDELAPVHSMTCRQGRAGVPER